MLFDGEGTALHAAPLNLGPDFSIGYWFNADSFKCLFVIQDPAILYPIFSTYPSVKSGKDFLTWYVKTIKDKWLSLEVEVPSMV
jgi:hypothetical protein